MDKEFQIILMRRRNGMDMLAQHFLNKVLKDKYRGYSHDNPRNEDG